MRYLLSCLLLAVVTAVYADNWEALDQELSWDADSVIELSPTSKQVSWRVTKYGMTDRHIGNIDCQIESIALVSSVSSHNDEALARYASPTVLNYVEGTQSYSVGHVKPMAPAMLAAKLRLPSPLSPEGRLIARVCGIDNAVKIRAARDSLDELVCSGKQRPTHYLCTMDDQGYLAYNNLIMRLSGAEALCGVERREIHNVLSGWLAALSRCRDGQDNCRGLIAIQASGLSEDLARALQGGQCTYIRGAQAKIDADRAQEAAWDRYRKCVRAKVIALDDAVSPAETIARAAYAQCRGQGPISSSHEVSQSVIDTITGLVLEGRQAKRNPGKKPAPRVAG